MVKSIVNPLSFSFATFATTGATSYQIFPLFWKAVFILENTCKLKVIAATADGFSANRKFFRMHKMGGEDVVKDDIVYRTLNIYADTPRYIYFFSDAPHLVKTARNAVYNSGSGRKTRYMWNNGFHILWKHIRNLFVEDKECALHMLPHLTNDHIYLNSFSTMNVRLAAQVLSSRVGSTLQLMGPAKAAGTAKFCLMVDTFFDCFNVRNTKEHRSKLKPNLAPYTDVNDPRFNWLKDEFIQCLDDWKASIEDNNAEKTDMEKAVMFLPWQTFEGFKMSVLSLLEVVPFLLSNGVTYVLTARFCQDDLENYFGRQRAIGRRKDNPNLRDVGYNDNIIKSSFSIRPIKGNCQAGPSKWNNIDDTPLPKKRKK